MKLTKQNVLKIKRETNNKLTKRVCAYVAEKWGDYDDKSSIFKDVLYYGCQSGTIGFLIYYSDTVAFYKRYKNEINELLYEALYSTGLSIQELFGDRFEKEDPLCNDHYNQNLLAWFGFEEALRDLAMNFKSLEKYL